MRKGFVMFACLVCIVFFPLPAKAEQTWAFYWYLCGSDLETRFGAATSDLQEILKARLPENVTVIIQTGGARKWHHSAISAKHIERFIFRKGKLERLERLPQANMGDGKTLASFLAFCKERYAADRQVFVFWNHGGGSIGGVANDENYDGDSLALSEIRQAFGRVYNPSENNPPFELIGFDTCLMATLDTANTVLGFGRYFVASQDLEPGNGWQYTGWLNALGKNPGMNGAELGKVMCDSYMKGCRDAGTDASATLSVIDMSKLPSLNIAYNALGMEAVSRAMERPEFFTTLGRQAKASENYMNSKSEGYTNMVDMGSLVSNMRKQLPEFTEFVLEALKEAVVYKVSGAYRKPSGLSCYYPFDGGEAGFEAMMSSGNITSFLILNGLQFGFLDTDAAVRELERISGDISAAVEDEESLPATVSSSSSPEASSQPSGFASQSPPPPPPPAPSGFASLSPPPAPSGFLQGGAVPSETPPVSPSTGFPVISGMFGSGGSAGSAGNAGGGLGQVTGILAQLSSNIGHVAPLEKLDITSLEDIDVGITDKGEAELVLGPERIRFIDSVTFYLAYCSVEDDIILLLGKDADMEADWDKGVFRDNFRGTWAALDGHLVYLEISNQEDTYNRYAVPIMLNGVRCNLIVIYDFTKEEYRILGARKAKEGSVVDKVLITLKEGDEVGTILKSMSISGEDDEFQDVTVETFKLGAEPVFEDIDMGDGTFMFMYEITDVQNNSATSKIVTFEVEGENITTSNE